MKKYLSMFLAICLTVSMLSLTSAAGAVTSSDSIAQQSIRAMGIITGDENGNMNLQSSVTRAEFVKMMVAASTYKNTIGTSSGYSLFRDVKQNHWAVEYIKLAVNKGWVVGYSDSTFHPESTITVEECATALLRLLGYTADDIVGTYPTAQLSKFYALDLGKNISKAPGEILSRNDCMTIFYNLMTATTKSNTPYAKSLGYTINSSGELDYSSLVTAEMKGPFVLASGERIESRLPFSSSNVTVYKDGSTSSLSSAATFDVYYYNTSLRTVWLYDTRVIGTYTTASPNVNAPTTVTVAGSNYTIGSSAAAYKLSSLGPFSIGSNVALLLGMNGTVVDVFPASDINCLYYGVVMSTQTSSYTNTDGSAVSEKTVKVACTDGIVRQYPGSFPAGSLVSVASNAGKTSISSLSSTGLSGMVNASGTTLGNYSFADNVEILDADSYGNYAKIYPSRLAGTYFTNSNISYYVLDASGKISKLILNNSTGDIFKYGYVTKADNNDPNVGSSISNNYSYIINGSAGSLRISNSNFGVTQGGAAFYYKDGSISSIKNLEYLGLSSLNEQYGVSGGKNYLLAENVQVYEEISSSYYLVSKTAVSDTSVYNLKGYYDNFNCNAGGRIRIIVASKKTVTE